MVFAQTASGKGMAMLDEYADKPQRSHIAVRRAPGPETAMAADEPVTFDPVFVGPENCDGCDPGLTVVIEGQVFVADLQGCDEEFCYYDYPTGVA
jgi:hypothetical protein